MKPAQLLVAGGVLLLGSALAHPALAAVLHKYFASTPASTCQLSVPTPDTEVRPRATGFRNESTSKSAFVICGFDAQEWAQNTLSLSLNAVSLDGQPHAMDCTAVRASRIGDLGYATKIVEIAGAGAARTDWQESDFISGGGGPMFNSKISVTCRLPPQVSITYLQSYQVVAVGE